MVRVKIRDTYVDPCLPVSETEVMNVPLFPIIAYTFINGVCNPSSDGTPPLWTRLYSVSLCPHSPSSLVRAFSLAVSVYRTSPVHELFELLLFPPTTRSHFTHSRSPRPLLRCLPTSPVQYNPNIITETRDTLPLDNIPKLIFVLYSITSTILLERPRTASHLTPPRPPFVFMTNLTWTQSCIPQDENVSTHVGVEQRPKDPLKRIESHSVYCKDPTEHTGYRDTRGSHTV